MFAADWTVLTILVVAIVVFFALTLSRRWRAAIARRFAKRVGLALPDELAPAIRTRLARRVRAGVLGRSSGPSSRSRCSSCNRLPMRTPGSGYCSAPTSWVPASASLSRP